MSLNNIYSIYKYPEKPISQAQKPDPMSFWEKLFYTLIILIFVFFAVCSFCIRQHLSHTNQCPACNHVSRELCFDLLTLCSQVTMVSLNANEIKYRQILYRYNCVKILNILYLQGACENNLRNNRLVDDLIVQFKAIRY